MSGAFFFPGALNIPQAPARAADKPGFDPDRRAAST